MYDLRYRFCTKYREISVHSHLDSYSPEKRAILPCQPGFALCPVLSGRRGVKECVDISSDVESVEAVWAKALARNAPHSILERQQTTSAVHVITNAPRATT